MCLKWAGVPVQVRPAWIGWLVCRSWTMVSLCTGPVGGSGVPMLIPITLQFRFGFHLDTTVSVLCIYHLGSMFPVVVGVLGEIFQCCSPSLFRSLLCTCLGCRTSEWTLCPDSWRWVYYGFSTWRPSSPSPGVGAFPLWPGLPCRGMPCFMCLCTGRSVLPWIFGRVVLSVGRVGLYLMFPPPLATLMLQGCLSSVAFGDWCSLLPIVEGSAVVSCLSSIGA